MTLGPRYPVPPGTSDMLVRTQTLAYPQKLCEIEIEAGWSSTPFGPLGGKQLDAP
jgi:hypothetical protein